MQAVTVNFTKRKVELADRPEPKLESDRQVLIQILEVGVCGTDREICSFDYGTPPEGESALVLGHENFGRVLEVGAAVDGIVPGDLVVSTVRRGCPENCPACAHDASDMCYTGHYTERGIVGAHGFMAERVVEEARYLTVIPPSLLEVGVLLEPLTICEKGIGESGLIQSRMPWRDAQSPLRGRGLRALVIGAGPVGALGAFTLRSQGFDVTVASLESPGAAKLRWVEAIGAHYVCTKEHDPADVERIVGNIDVMFEATGSAQVSFDYMAHLGTNGVYILTGVPGRKHDISVPGDAIMKDLVLKNQVVFGTVNANIRIFERAAQRLALLERRWPEALRSLITQRAPATAYADLLLGERSDDQLKQVLRFSE